MKHTLAILLDLAVLSILASLCFQCVLLCTVYEPSLPAAAPVLEAYSGALANLAQEADFIQIAQLAR